ncbi:MAG: hypothetical protein JO091_04375 [Acidobacteriaceae bacterium]|nr:hypothetical protein [Acidobacteriaceae bacterium]
MNWPFTEQSVIDVLQERSVRSVTIDHFRRTYWPPGCVAEGIHFLHRKHKDKPPLISIQKLVIKGSYTAMLTIDPRLSRVIVIGMHVTVPPSDPNGGPNPVMPLTHSNTPGPAMVIDRLVADGTVLDFMSREPGKKPFHLAIDKLVIDGVGNNAPLAYRTIISNSLPPGKIRSAGVFGPWNPDNPASTPVKGSYTYENANLAAFSALSGTLSSSGKFSGTLGRIAVEGTAEVPNFHLTNTSHTRKLSAEFHATVDGTNGDTMLESVAGHFDRTTVFCQGGVIGQKGENGKTISLDMVSRNGRIEDLLKLFISARQAPMTGSVSLRAHVEVPPGEQPFVQRMNLTGDFGVDAGKFTNKETQAAIDRLSAGDQGKKAEENAQNALSDLRGHAAATNGVAKLSNLSFRVPDATARLHGTYGLREPYNINLHGTLATTHPSDATTGFKSFLLRAMTPFLSKKGHDRIVPFKIIGNYHAAQTGLDLGSKQ